MQKYGKVFRPTRAHGRRNLVMATPESLFRFKCVERSWYFLINDVIRNPKFVTKHLNNSKKKASSFIIKCDVHELMGHSSVHIYHNENNRQRLVSSLKDLAPLLPKCDDVRGAFRTGGISHCNGIICIANFLGCHIVLWNPATRELKHLPDPCSHNRILNGLTKVGFGYDYIDNVYKVVRVFRRLGTFKAEVYTLGLDAWRDVEVNQVVESFNEYPAHTKVVHCKGFYYWLACKTPTPNLRVMQMIHSFDMHKEKFDTIPLPDIVQSREFSTACRISLTEWNESFALIYIPGKERNQGKSIDIWVLHDSSEGHRNSPSWTKQLSLDPGQREYS